MSAARAGFVTGSRFEASALPAGTPMICTGLNAVAQRDQIAAFAGGNHLTALISFGFAGALDTNLQTGALIIADSISMEDGTVEATDPALRAQLTEALPSTTVGRIYAGGTVVATPARKQEVHARTGALAAEMEAHIVMTVADRLGLPFAALRAISDTAQTALPPFVANTLRDDGSVDGGKLLADMARNPSTIPQLATLARGSYRARAALRAAARAALGAAPLVA